MASPHLLYCPVRGTNIPCLPTDRLPDSRFKPNREEKSLHLYFPKTLAMDASSPTTRERRRIRGSFELQILEYF